MTHTPGPWTAVASGIPDFWSICAPAGHITYVCLRAEKGELPSNALLIAAAPELLEAARTVLNSFVLEETKDAKLLYQLRTAIHKATTP